MADPNSGAPTGDTPATTDPVAQPAATTTTAEPAKTDPVAQPAATTADPAPAAKTDPAPAAKTDPAPTEPTDWATIRTKIANGDEKLEKRLARYSSVESLAQALIAAQNKISDGSLKSALPKDATPEQLAQWREENGIPADPKDYDLTLPDGLLIGEEDQPIVDEFVALAHSKNMTPDQVKDSIAWYMNLQEQQAEEQASADLAAKEQATTAVKEMWGSEYDINKNLIKGLVAQAPDGAADLILSARLADGTPMMSHAPTLRWLADLARTVNPTATVVPGSGQNAAQAIENELADIQKLMGDKQSDYWKGPKAEKMQERYRQLISVQQKMQS